MTEFRRSYTNNQAVRKEPSGRVNKYWGMYVGIVKDNADVQRMGRLKVWIPELGSDQRDENSWRTVGYCSPFAGATPPQTIGEDKTSYEQTQTSYGMWFIPPDLEAQVVIFFANGDPGRGYWFGCLYNQLMNNMVPGIAASDLYLSQDNAFPTGKTVPVGEYNKRTTININDNVSRPVANPYYEGVSSQGLINDNVRGTTTSSARRESPSSVFGISTPGPKIEPDNANNDRRQGGHSFVLDDGLNTEHITFRTRSGAQIRIDETNGLIYFINKKGTGWIQIDDAGNADIFAANNMSLRAQNDFNIRADNDINIEAGHDINIKARKDKIGDPGQGIGDEGAGDGGNIKVQALSSIDITIEVDAKINVKNNFDLMIDVDGKITTTNNLDIKAGGNLNAEATSDVNIKAGGNLNVEAGGDSNNKAGGNLNNESGSNLNNKSGGTLSNEASGDVNAKAGGNHNIGAGGNSNIQAGGSHSEDASAINMNSGASSSPGSAGSAGSAASAATSAIADVSITQDKTNVLESFTDQYKFERNTETLNSIITRLMTYEPCPAHENKGDT